MLHIGIDLSRTRIDYCALSDDGEIVEESSARWEEGALAELAMRFPGREPVEAVIESMNGARFVHDELELLGWEVKIADAAKVKGMAPLACKTDKVDARVLAQLSLLDLVPEIWLPNPHVRQDRERSRFRIRLVHQRSALKQRISATLMSFGVERTYTDMFGKNGRLVLEELLLPKAWRQSLDASLELIDFYDLQIGGLEREIRLLGKEHPYVPLLTTVPGIGPILAYTIAAEIGDIARFPSPAKLCGYTGLCPRVYQSGNHDRRGSLAKNGPRHLRWALVEAAQYAARSPHYLPLHERTVRRLGRGRGSKIARVEVARKLAEAIWHMLTENTEFAPGGAAQRLAA